MADSVSEHVYHVDLQPRSIFDQLGLSDVTSQVTWVNAGIEPVCQENVHCINHWAQLTQQHNSHPKTN